MRKGGGAELSNLHWMGKYRFMVLICAGEKLYNRIFMFPGRQNDSIDMCCHVLGENNHVNVFCWRGDSVKLSICAGGWT